MKNTLLSTPVVIVSAVGLLSILVIAALFVTPQVTPFAPASPADATEIAAELPETVNVQFTLETFAKDGRFGFIGIGGEIDGVLNPDLVVQPGDVVQLTLLNGDGLPHDLAIPDFDVKLPYVSKVGDQAEVTFAVNDIQLDSYVYYCTVPGRRQLGQKAS